MALLILLVKNPVAFALLAVPLLYSIIIHEVAHGWVAYRMGDPTAKWLGRLSLNPLKHLDLFGTIMLFVVGFGWAKPVPININNIPDRRKGLLFVSAAGIVANILFALLALLIFRLFFMPPTGMIGLILHYVAEINITLAAVNLIPIPPVDGSKILMAIAPPRLGYILSRLEPYGFFILIGLLYLGFLDPLIGFFRAAIEMVIGLLLSW
jgi:Zn-dependent protease